MSEEQWEDVSTHVFESLGAASTCWESMEGTGVFDSDRAKQIGDDLMTYLREQFPEFPREEGGYTIIGPECFATGDGLVLAWRGVNYVPQSPDVIGDALHNVGLPRDAGLDALLAHHVKHARVDGARVALGRDNRLISELHEYVEAESGGALTRDDVRAMLTRRDDVRAMEADAT